MAVVGLLRRVRRAWDRVRPRRYVWDAVGVLCNVFALALIAFANYTAVFHTVIPWLGLGRTAVTILSILAALDVLVLWSYARAVFSDPGLVPLPPPDYVIEPLVNNMPALRFGEPVKICSRCENYKPFMAHHCRTCNRCVRLMDHHCIWVNNCVGEQTQKYFILFLLYIGVLGSFLLVLVSARFSVCVVDGTAACGARNKIADFILGIFLLMIAVLFTVFVVIMGVDQVRSLVNEESYIDRLQREQAVLTARASSSEEDPAASGTGGPAPSDYGEVDPSAPLPKRSWLHKMERAFGSPSPSRWWWLLPTDPGIRRARWYQDWSG